LGIRNVFVSFVTMVGLQIILVGKEVVTPDGHSLGIVEKIKVDLTQDKFWMVVADGLQGHWDILIDQVKSLSRQIVLFDVPQAFPAIETVSSAVVVTPVIESTGH